MKHPDDYAPWPSLAPQETQIPSRQHSAEVLTGGCVLIQLHPQAATSRQTASYTPFTPEGTTAGLQTNGDGKER
jgi:hypothetical protein